LIPSNHGVNIRVIYYHIVVTYAKCRKDNKQINNIFDEDNFSSVKAAILKIATTGHLPLLKVDTIFELYNVPKPDEEKTPHTQAKSTRNPTSSRTADGRHLATQEVIDLITKIPS
jgi:hypothetical protein